MKEKGSGEKEAVTPRPEDFSKRAVNRAVLSEAVQHPTTLLSAATAILSGLYMGLVSPSETAFAVAAGSAVFSLLSWVYHYFVRGDKLAKKYVQELKEKRKNYQVKRVENIEQECRRARFPQGARAARELKAAYTRLVDYLKEKGQNKAMTAHRFLVLAEECYDRGTIFLDKALSLYRALSQIDKRKLKKELKDWEKEISQLEKNKNEGDEHKRLVLQALQEKIRSHKKRLELVEKRSKTIKQMMAQCEILEATLDSAYLEVVDIMETGTYVNQDNVATNLERAVEAARRVEDRLRGLGKEEGVDDSIYLNAAKDK